MLETYRERLSAIEDYYNARDFIRTISECGTLIEHVISDTFREFHTHLETPSDRKKFFDFEQKQWEHYSRFIQRPTMGVSIRFYAPLSKGLFKDHPRMNGDVVKPLGEVNEWRNKVAHAGSEPPSEDDADDVLENTENIIRKMGIEDDTHDKIGIPISTYLILSSILQKSESAESEGDFRQIIGDSRKLIPSLVNLCLEREYALLTLEQKEVVVDQYVADGTMELELQSGASVLKKIDFFDRVEGDLERHMERIMGDSGSTFTFRAIRPYTSLLKEFNSYLRSEADDISVILGFADQIKEKYLNENQIDDSERLELEIMGKHQGIPKNAMVRLEDDVVSAIEADIVTFQTFHSSGSDPADNTVDIEAQLIEMISMGTPLTAISTMASAQGYQGNVQALFDQHAPEITEPEPEPVDQAVLEVELTNFIQDGTPLSAVERMAAAQGYEGDVQSLFDRHAPQVVESLGPIESRPRVVAELEVREDKTYSKIDGAEMVLIPAGELVRRGFKAEMEAFYMDIHPVTNTQYKKFVEDTGHPEPVGEFLVGVEPQQEWVKCKVWEKEGFNGDDQPVVAISWIDAMLYAKWSGKRLPTEAEWEYAARGGLEKKKYPWGNEDPDETRGNLVDLWGGEGGSTTSVTQFPPNGYGLFDLVGNAEEMTLEPYSSKFSFCDRESVMEIVSTFDGLSSLRELDSEYGYMHIAARGGYKYTSFSQRHKSASYADVAVGFRCVVSLEDLD